MKQRTVYQEHRSELDQEAYRRGFFLRSESLEVRGVSFLIVGAPMHWSQNKLHELHCDKCERPLVVLFAARSDPDITPNNPRWWVPTAVTCACLLPKVATLAEMPKRPRRPKTDKRQLEFQC